MNEPIHPMLTFLAFGIGTAGLWSGYKLPQRLGLALGLLFHFSGFLLAMFLVLRQPSNNQPEPTSTRSWLWFGGILLAIGLAGFISIRVLGENRFLSLGLWLFLLTGFASLALKAPLGNLPLSFWLCVTNGALLATVAWGASEASQGAYMGAWLWILPGLRPSAFIPAWQQLKTLLSQQTANPQSLAPATTL
jgi:hypothetical protein